MATIIAAGRSYVVFGGPKVGSNGVVALSSLNGTNGFKLDGEIAGSFSGFAVNTAGDVNNDGHPDLIIGAYGFGGNTGRSYVVFGGPNIADNGLIDLSGLNGSNGFSLQGESADDKSGFAVSDAGDINSDGISDLMIGAYGFGGYAGRTYAIYGNKKIGVNGAIRLSDTGNNIKFMGETGGDASGCRVSGIGDINGDGHEDMLIGASLASRYGLSAEGRSYVVFGGTWLNNGGNISLSVLNGTNGFKIDGEASGDVSGAAVSKAGDVNGDGYPDLLIGAWEASRNGLTWVGCSYVVFGGPGVGNGGLVNLSSLNGINGFKLVGEADHDGSGYSLWSSGYQWRWTGGFADWCRGSQW